MLLFASSLFIWTIGNGLVPILPVYALELETSEAVTGYYLAFAFICLTAGTFFTGWLTDKLQHRKLVFIIARTTMIPLHSE